MARVHTMALMDSAYAKLGRSKEHLAELRTAVESFREQDLDAATSTNVDEHPSDPSLAVVSIRLRMEVPQRWSLIMGDILTNLRAALDHAIYGHADSRTDLNSSQRRDLKYPICDQRHDWHGLPDSENQDGTIRKGRTGAREELRPLVAPEVLDLIEQSQPFQLDRPEWHDLAILSGLVNRDKHRAVIEVPIKVAEMALTGIELDVISQSEPVITPDGVTVTATLRRPHRPAGAEPRDVPVNFGAALAFMEEVELPRTNTRRPFLVVMERLVKQVGDQLDALRAAGC